MSYLFKMAWRNIWRHRGRTALSIAAVLAGVSIVILTKGFADGMTDSIVNYSINLNSGHVRIIRPEYQTKERLLSLAYPIGEGDSGYAELVGELRNSAEVEEAMGRIRFGLLLVVGEKKATVMGVGADLPREDRVARLGRFLQGKGEGRLAAPGRQEIVLGEKLLAKLGLKVGDKVNGVFSTSFGSFKIATFRIVGGMASGLGYLDESLAYIPLDVAMNLLELEDAVTEIVVFGADADRTPALQKIVAGLPAVSSAGLLAIPWQEYNEMISYIVKAEAIYFVIYFFLVFLASFVVLNTLMMVVSERTREIGMLSALGFSPGAIRKLFLWEGLLIAVFGSTIGAILGGACNLILSRVGFDLSSYMDTAGDAMLLTPRLYSSFSPADMLFGLVLGMVVTVVATLLPARRAAKMRPTEALRTI